MEEAWQADDIGFMRKALALAAAQLGRTAGSPAVGCVIVKNSELIGMGATYDGGRPHGEAMALANVSVCAHGATAFVTLEPCAHKSERGPTCVDALIEAGIARLVCCLQDPDPRTSGKGFQRLQDAGVTVEVGLLREEGAIQIADFASQFVVRGET